MERHNSLREKVKSKTATREERIEYFQALLHGEHDEVTFAEAREAWDANTDLTSEETELMEQVFQGVGARTRGKVRPLYARPSWIAAAAATLFIFTIAGFWLYQRTGPGATEVVAETMHTITGPDYVTLPDFSKVELKAGSTLTYTDAFGITDRFVKLSGTGFFDVTHNPTLAFKVQTGKVVATVLGTAFNINEDAQFVEVTVVRGKVAVGDEKAVYQTILPNEKIVVDTKYMGYTLRHTNTEVELAWKANNIIFDGTTMNEAIEKLEQRFNVDIEIANESLNACKVNVWFTKGNETLNDILTPVCVVLEAQAIRKGNKIVIEGGKGCQ